MALLLKKRNPLLSDTGVQILNYRIEQEELSARLYLSMSMWLNDNGYVGAAKRWKQYSDEEILHSNWAREYLLAMGVQPSTPALAQMKQTFGGLPDIIHMSYNHEITVTKQCKEMAASAQKEGDYLLYQFAFKYLSEQVEEHEKMQDLVDKLEAFGTDKIALRLLDEELGK
jgi:ferritin